MKKLVSILTVALLVIGAVFLTAACKSGKHGDKCEMCCKADCCEKCDGKACCEGKACKEKCEKMCSEGKCCTKADCCTKEKCNKDCCDQCKEGKCCSMSGHGKHGDKKDCCKKGDKKVDQETSAAAYGCPMHPEITADKPGTCSECGMDLEKK